MSQFKKINTSQKVTKTQLKNILGVSYPTALKEYQVIVDSLALKRKYLQISDLITYGILP
ncbi:hypothetical protein FNW25_01410 [Flavobacterium franklandianum]|uniref:hypothetical protein n=1 Tax=Flavobacterium franklandianum TaxID=2594430 RepID=UPI00117B6983|nr:hypothetical protein [Flavobacterium franklandianum]TRX29644.1 hypothetical protein FNW25_01410 [Flavobacterium franklandianum]